MIRIFRRSHLLIVGVLLLLLVFTSFGCGSRGGGGIAASSIDSEPLPVSAALTASTAVTEEFIYEGSARVAVSCTTAETVTSMEVRCADREPWQAVTSGTSLNCTYTTTGSYSPVCRINGSEADAVDTPVTIKDFYKGDNYTINSNTKDVSRMDYLTTTSITDTTLTFTTTDPSRVALTTGDVLVETNPADGESGFMRKVSSVTISGDTVTVQTEDASLVDIFEYAELEGDGSSERIYNTESAGRSANLSVPTPSDIVDAAVGVVASSYPDMARGVKKSYIIEYNVEEDFEVFDLGGLKIEMMEGSGLAYAAGSDLFLVIKDGELKVFHFFASGEFGLQTDFRITLDDVTPSFTKQKLLYTYPTPPIFVGPIPINFRFDFFAGVNTTAELDASIEAGFYTGASFYAGAYYVEGKDWTPASSFEHSFETHGPTYDGDAELSIKGFIKPEIGVEVCYSSGPAVNIAPYLEAELGNAEDYGSYWNFNVGMDVNLVFKVKLLSWRLARFEANVHDFWTNITGSDLELEASTNINSGALSNGQLDVTLTCDVSSRPTDEIHSIKGRCNTSDAWQTVSGEQMTCTYTAAGTYQPGCIVNQGDEDEMSDISGSVLVTSAPDQPPSAVTLSTPGGATETSLDLSWTQSTDSDFASYKVYYSSISTVNQGYPLVAEVTTKTTTTTTKTGLSAGTTYYFKVYVCDAGGQCTASGTASAATVATGCGNTFVSGGEECDDGNTDGGDGCSSTCTTETLATNAWIRIPAGDFVMGCAAADAACAAITRELPKHTVTLSEYKIQKYEVTNAQYKACVTAGTCTAPASANSGTRIPYYGNATYDTYPVLQVDWAKANTYCGWIGARLPTEAEWEKAARGASPNESIYPWGNSAGTCTLANYQGCTGNTDEVGAHPTGASAYGVMDMAGNISEWVSDWYSGTYYTDGGPTWNDPQGPGPGTVHVFKGGSWNNSTAGLRNSYRYTSGNDPAYLPYWGFRCVKN